jgi:hypothetical protein
MHTPEYFQQLLKGHLEGTLSPGEESVFMEAVRSGNYRDILRNDILSRLEEHSPLQTDLSHQTQERIIQHILGSEALSPEKSHFEAPAPIIPVSRNRRRRWTIAAAAAIIVITGTALLYRHNTSTDSRTQTAHAGIVNTTSEIKNLHLEDGSIIELAPGAHLSYPAHFTGASRTVQLEGNAFFKIATDPRRPFYVYCRDIVTHVLGTSFHISSQKDNMLKIAVRTGKVEISRSGEGQHPGIVLTPNQQLVYTQDDPDPQPRLVDTPMVLTDNPDDRTFVAGETFRFKAASLNDISRLVKEKYGIGIILEKPALGKKLFTGDLSNQPLNIALKFICLSVGASYEIKGTKIFLNTYK